jgi:hypothetical protein
VTRRIYLLDIEFSLSWAVVIDPAQLDLRRSPGERTQALVQMIVALVAAFLLGISPAFACLLWTMKRLTEEERRASGPQDYLEPQAYDRRLARRYALSL